MDILDFKKYISFTAIDFETANANANSICQIGLVRVENGEIVHEYAHLVQPPDNAYHYGCIRVHGITPEATINAPTFDMLYPEIEQYIEGQNVVAHNAAFDTRCLKTTLKYYCKDIPTFKQHCTVKIYKRNLAFLAKEHNYDLKHHDALSDARVCALLFKKYLEEKANAVFTLVKTQ